MDFWWLDWQQGGSTTVPGLDPLWMLNHVHYLDSGRERTRTADDGSTESYRRRPVTFSRFADASSHRTPVGFSGDTIVTWDSLRFQPEFTATAANIGYFWWSNDIGGHMLGSAVVLPPGHALYFASVSAFISLLVPLWREEKVAAQLIDALAAMEYPASLLDIKLVLEECDETTRAAIARATLPPTIEIINVPADRDGLRTKPRAMNYALPFCKGEIVGVYDAEDRPHPGQIRAVVQHLEDADDKVACVQGYLDFYNTSENWLSRCFTIEYAIWFRVILHGVQKLGIPIPLGGTTVFFRRRELEEALGTRVAWMRQVHSTVVAPAARARRQFDGALVAFFSSDWRRNRAAEDFPELRFLEVREQHSLMTKAG